MRLIVMFDLPTLTQKDRREYREFRKFLINEGFIMHQYSVYSKIFLNNINKEFIVNRIRKNGPKKGLVSLLSITEKQFAKMIYITGEKDDRVANTDKRIVFLGEEDDDQS